MRSQQGCVLRSQLCPETLVIDDFPAHPTPTSAWSVWAGAGSTSSALVLHFPAEAASAVGQPWVTIVSQASGALRYLFMRSEFIPSKLAADSDSKFHSNQPNIKERILRSRELLESKGSQTSCDRNWKLERRNLRCSPGPSSLFLLLCLPLSPSPCGPSCAGMCLLSHPHLILILFL